MIVIANIVSWALLGLASLQSPQVGTSTFMLTRASFGSNGTRGISFFNWLTQVGYETEGITLVVLALLALLAKANVHASTGLKVGLIIAAALVQLIIPLFGHATISKVLRYVSFAFIIVFLLMAILAAGKVDIGKLNQHASTGTLVAAFALAIALGGLGWTENANDYSRYLPANTSKRATFFAAIRAGGGLLP